MAIRHQVFSLLLLSTTNEVLVFVTGSLSVSFSSSGLSVHDVMDSVENIGAGRRRRGHRSVEVREWTPRPLCSIS